MSATQSQSIGLPKRRSQPVVRLDSLKNPQPRPVPQAKKPPSECPNPDCGETGTGVEEDGKTICGACGSVITEMTMVSEVTYGLASGGAHVVHGYHVGANQAYAKRGEVVDRNRAMSSREVTIANGEPSRYSSLRVLAKSRSRAQIHGHDRYSASDEPSTP